MMERTEQGPFVIEWRSRGGLPREAPNRAFPDGIDIDCSGDAANRCTVELPRYPAPAIGVYSIRCVVCRRSFALTAAGRVDDPRMVTLPCGDEPIVTVVRSAHVVGERHG